MKKKTSDAIDAKLRAEPDYKELGALLDAQSPARKTRLAYELTASQRCAPSHNQGADPMEPKTKAVDTRILEMKDSDGLSFTDIADRLNLEGFTNQAGGTFTKKSVGNRYYRLKGKLSSQAAQGCEDTFAGERAAIVANICEDDKAAEHPANVARRGESERPEPNLANHANGCEDDLDHMPDDVSCESCEPCEDVTGTPGQAITCEPSQPCEDTDTALTPESVCEPCDDEPTVGHVANDAKPCETPVGEPANIGDDSQDELPSHMIATLRKVIREELKALSGHDPNLANPAKPDVDLPPPTPKITGSKKFMGTRVNLPGCRVDKALADGFEAERRNLAISASELMQRILWLYLGKPWLSFESGESKQSLCQS